MGVQLRSLIPALSQHTHTLHTCSRMYWGTCVVFPHPVSPHTTATSLAASAASTDALTCAMGRPALDACNAGSGISVECKKQARQGAPIGRPILRCVANAASAANFDLHDRQALDACDAAIVRCVECGVGMHAHVFEVRV
eukprot:145965-Chlamydomonas_euryale.AAC.6